MHMKLGVGGTYFEEYLLVTENEPPAFSVKHFKSSLIDRNDLSISAQKSVYCIKRDT